MSEEPANLNPDQQVAQPGTIDSVPGVEPASTEQTHQQPQNLVDSVPAATSTEVAPAQPSDGSEYHGGYAGQRLSADGTSPNVPVINDPSNSDILGAAARQVQGQGETPKE